MGKSLNKKKLLMDLEADLILMEQIEETRIMTKEMNIDKNYETLALTFGYCCFFSAALPITVLIMWLFSLLKLFVDVYSVSFSQRYLEVSQLMVLEYGCNVLNSLQFSQQ